MQSGYTRMSCRAVLCWRYRLVLTNFSKLFATSENVFLRSYGPKQSQRLLLLFILKEYDFSSIESGKDFTLLIEIKGNYIKAGTEMLKWISRWRTKVLGGGRGVWREDVRALGLCSQPDSAFGCQQREWDQAFMRGKHLSRSQGVEKGRGR